MVNQSSMPAPDKSAAITEILAELKVDLDQPLSEAELGACLRQDWHLEQETIHKAIIKELAGQTLRGFTMRMDAALQVMPYATEAVRELRSRGLAAQLARHVDLKDKLRWMMILEALVRLSDDDITFLQASHAEYKEKIGAKLQLSRGSFFTYVKYLTVDSSMRFRLRMQTEADPLGYFRRKRFIRFLKLPLNIVEATVTDFLRGHWKNALTGWLLATSPTYHYAFDPNKKRINYEMREGYEEPYLLWNLTFCLRTRSREIHRVIPKLFFPRILSDRSSEFCTTRGLSLWYVLQTIFLRQDQPCDDWLLELSRPCAEVFGQQAWLSTRVYKKQKKFEFFRHLLQYYRSEDKD